MATTNPESVTRSSGALTTSILARFKVEPGVTNAQYDETVNRLETLGEWPPEGLAYHVAFRSEGCLRVSEVWDSREKFDAFGKRLMPVLKDAGIELSGEPEMLEVHNIIKR